MSITEKINQLKSIERVKDDMLRAVATQRAEIFSGRIVEQKSHIKARLSEMAAELKSVGIMQMFEEATGDTLGGDYYREPLIGESSNGHVASGRWKLRMGELSFNEEGDWQEAFRFRAERHGKGILETVAVQYVDNTLLVSGDCVYLKQEQVIGGELNQESIEAKIAKAFVSPHTKPHFNLPIKK